MAILNPKKSSKSDGSEQVPVVEANGGPGFAKTKILFSKYDRELRTK
jgi:hypothetical protein